MLAAPPAALTVPPQPPLTSFRGDPLLVREIRVGGDPDPLVTIPPTLDPRIVYDTLPLPARPEALLRGAVVARLVSVSDALPPDFALTVLDGWRSAEFQQALLDYYRSKLPTLESSYVSDPSDAQVVAPHTTGGAVDLTLSWRGLPLALGTDFDAFEQAAHLEAFEAREQDTTVRDLRRLLSHEMRAAGFSPYPWEWWHWSYGDQWWAADHGLDQSLYAAVQATA